MILLEMREAREGIAEIAAIIFVFLKLRRLSLVDNWHLRVRMCCLGH